MGFEALFAGLAELLAPAAEAAPAALGAAEAAVPTAEAGLAAATQAFGAFSPEAFAAEAGAIAPAAIEAGVPAAGLAADLIPEAATAGELPALGAGGSQIAASSLGPLAGGGGLGFGGAAVPGGTLGGGFASLPGAGVGLGGDLSTLLGPVTTDALAPPTGWAGFAPDISGAQFAGDPLSFGASSDVQGGVFGGPAQFGPTALQPNIVESDFSALGQPSFLPQVQTPTDIVGPTSTFNPAQATGVPGGVPTGTAENLANLESQNLFTPTSGVGTLTDVPVSAANPLSGAQIGGAAPPPPGFTPFTPTGVPMAPAVFPTDVAAAPAAPGAAPEAAAAAAPAAGGTLASLTPFAPLATTGLSAAGLGLNIARGLNTPTVPVPPAQTNALAPTAPAMDANQMKQLLLNEGMSPQQADQYIAQINARLASQGTSGNPDALSSGLVTAG